MLFSITMTFCPLNPNAKYVGSKTNTTGAGDRQAARDHDVHVCVSVLQITHQPWNLHSGTPGVFLVTLPEHILLSSQCNSSSSAHYFCSCAISAGSLPTAALPLVNAGGRTPCWLSIMAHLSDSCASSVPPDLSVLSTSGTSGCHFQEVGASFQVMGILLNMLFRDSSPWLKRICHNCD